MQLRGWNTAIAAGAAGIACTVVFDLMGLVAGQGWSVPRSRSPAHSRPVWESGQG